MVDEPNVAQPDAMYDPVLNEPEDNAAPVAQEAPVEGTEVTASDPGVTVVDAPPSEAAPGAPIVGTHQAPLPGEQPGVSAITPTVKNSAADPNPTETKASEALDPQRPGSAEEEHPEATQLGASKPLPPVVNTVTDPIVRPGVDQAEVHNAASTDQVATDAEEAHAGEEGDQYAHLTPSKRPPQHRPTPAGPPSHPRHKRPHTA